jgi:IS5 family transposase
VRTVAIPRQATTSAARKAIEHGRGSRRLDKWRTGCEGRISYLKRGNGWDRTCWTAGTEPRSGAGTGVFTHNLIKIGTLASRPATKHQPSPKPLDPASRQRLFRSK